MQTRSPDITTDPAPSPVRLQQALNQNGAKPGSRADDAGFMPSLPPSQELVMWNRLTPREQDVLYGIAKDLSNKQIAASLGIGIGTVKAHVKRMFLKLGVNDRAIAPLVALGQLEHAARMPRTRPRRPSVSLSRRIA